jgi:hypothetical protein
MVRDRGCLASKYFPHPPSAHPNRNSYRQSVTNSNKIARALRDPSVFKLCNNAPMFQTEPELVRKKLNVATFRLSLVGGHTPKARGLNGGSKKKRVQGKAIESDWRLDLTEEADRINLFGHLPRSSCREYEKTSNEFPVSLKRKYLNLRNQSFYTKMLLHGQAGNIIMAVGRSSTIVKELETIYCMDNFHRDGRSRLHKVSDDVGAEEKNVDSDCDCRSLDCDRMSLGGRSNSHGTENLESKSISPENSLEGIFGPIIHVDRDIRVDPARLASLFDAEHHRNCAVIAPLGMTLHESSDEDIESASSTLSEMSINNNEELCAFFDNINTSDSGVQPSQKPQISEMMTPHLDHTDAGAEDLDCDFAATYHIYEDDKDDAASSEKVATFVTEGGIHANSYCKKNTNEERNEVVIEKENINTQSQLRTAREHNQSCSSFAKRGSQLPCEEIAERESFILQNMSDECCEYEHRALQADQGEFNLPSHTQGKSPVVTSFRLPTPPPSSDESDDDCSDEGIVLQHGPVHDANHDSSLEEETIDVLVEDTALEEARSSKSITLFQLQTQYSSSDGEEDDDDDSEESNEHPPACVFPTTNNLFLPSDEVNKAVAGASSENVGVGLKTPLLDQCLTNAEKSKHAQFKTESSNIFSGAEDLTDTPVKARFPVNSTAKSGQIPRMSLDSLSDTPLHPRLTFGQQRKSLDCLTDTPCQPRQNDKRQSLDSLTDTPLERPRNARQQLKRLRAAPDKHSSRKPEASSTEKVPEKERVRKRIEDKYRCKFLDAEAANDDSDESDEDEAIKQIEDEEMSQ